MLLEHYSHKKEAVSKVIYCREDGKSGRKQYLNFNIYRLIALPAFILDFTFETDSSNIFTPLGDGGFMAVPPV